MSVKVVHINLEFDYRRFAAKMYAWRRENAMLQRECDELIGWAGYWSEIERRRVSGAPFQAGMTLESLLKIVNLMDMSPEELSTYFILEK